ncbi:MAG: tetratricopeptide repeat protein [Bryobacterales bacterium]|nr:tetratricopeptide repeat protein [Bryobacterales bacterium]
MIVARVFLMLILTAGLGWAQASQPPAPAPTPAPAEPEEEEPSLKPKEYELNPIQAENEIRVGRYYMKKGSFRAAAGRFDEATKWNPASSEAYLMLGEAREKLKDGKGARAAYEKYLEIAPDGKSAEDVKKRLAKLGKKK